MRIFRKIFVLPILFAIVVATTSALAVTNSVVQSGDRVEVNWSTLKVRFYGDAEVAANAGSDDLKKAEATARTNGLNQGKAALSTVFAKEGLPTPEIDRLLTGATSYNTMYFAQGKVRVYLESSLARAFKVDNHEFKEKTVPSGESRSSGLVFKLTGSSIPLPAYQIVDEAGNVLFKRGDMAAAGYEKHLMGHWFTARTSGQVGAVVGESPERMTLKPTAPGTFQIERAAWQQAIQGNEVLLAAGKIALVVP